MKVYKEIKSEFFHQRDGKIYICSLNCFFCGVAFCQDDGCKDFDAEEHEITDDEISLLEKSGYLVR